MTKFGAEVFTVILVIILLCYSEKCNSQSENAFVSNIYNKVRGLHHKVPDRPLDTLPLLNRNQHGLPLQPHPYRARFQDSRRKLKKSEKIFINTPRRVLQRRLVRQAYTEYRPALYPSLPTPPTSYHQSSANQNYQRNQTSYTPPYNPQWQPTSMQNYSQPGYPGYTPSNNNGFNNPGKPSNYYTNYPPYSSRPSGPVTPNPADNPLFGHGHDHRYPYTSPNNYSNFGSQSPSGYPSYPGAPKFNDRPTPGYSQSHGMGNKTFTYNPSQRPPYYPSGNSSINSNTPRYSSYSTTQRYPVPFYNNTTQRTPYKYPNQIGPNNNPQSGVFNRSGIPGYTNGPHGAYNPGQNYPRHSLPGIPSQQLNSTVGFYGIHQTGLYNASFNGYAPNSNVQYPSRHNDNNFTNTYNMNPNSGVGYNGHNNFAYSTNKPNPGTYNPQAYNQQPGGGSYPKPQFNGTSTYRIADYYTPNIPNHPPRNDNMGQHYSFYPSNAIHDPTRVPPERFSY